jgi:uncharacterized protein (TIGR02588 family)
MTRLDKNGLEWSVFAIALLLVLATFGYLVREALTTDSGPPDVAVSLGPPTRGAGGHLVPVTAENHGTGTAEEVRITVRLEGRGPGEEAVLVVPYLPRGSRRSGWVTFRSDPAAGSLRVAGVAFQAP